MILALIWNHFQTLHWISIYTVPTKHLPDFEPWDVNSSLNPTSKPCIIFHIFDTPTFELHLACYLRRNKPSCNSCYFLFFMQPYEGTEVMLWTNHRVMEWLRSVDLSEYAPNLRGSGVHGALMVRTTFYNLNLGFDAKIDAVWGFFVFHMFRFVHVSSFSCQL